MHLVRGQGSHLFDVDGVRYLDAYNNVASVGHCHPHVVEAVSEQMATLNTHTRYLHRGIVDYSERLLATMPDEVDQVMYACTGSEANDLALRVAEMRHRRNGCHRSPATPITATRRRSPRSRRRSAARPASVPMCASSPPPDTYRVPAGELAARFAADVARAADDLIDGGLRRELPDRRHRSSPRTASTPTRRSSAAAVEAVRRRGGVFIADEVQPGFARTGASMWGFDRHGVVPDIVTMGKPMGNGIPIAAMAARADVLAAVRCRRPVLQHLRRQPGVDGRGGGGARRDRGRGPAGQRRDGR